MTIVNLQNLTHKEFVNHLTSVTSEEEAFTLLPEAAKRMEYLIDSLEFVKNAIDELGGDSDE